MKNITTNQKLYLVIILIFLTTIPITSFANDMEQIYQLFIDKKETEAIKLLEVLCKNNTKNPEAYLYLGVAKRNDKSFKEAIALFEKGLSFEPNHTSLLLELATTHSWNQNLNSSLLTYKKLLKYQPSNPIALNGEARILSWMGELEKSKETYERVLKNNPPQPQMITALLGLGFVHGQLLKVDDAEKFYKKVLTIDPDNQSAKTGLNQLNSITRTMFQVQSGTSWFEGSRRDLIGNILGEFKINPSVKLYGKYELSFPSGIGKTTGQPAGERRHRGELGLSFIITKKLTLQTSYGISFTKDITIHQVGVRASFKAKNSLVLLGGIRMELENNLRTGALVDLGAQWIPVDKFWFMTQLYIYTDTKSTSSISSVATIWWQMFPALSIRTGAGLGKSNGSQSYSANGAIKIMFNQNIGIGASYSFVTIPSILIRRHELRATFETRF